MQNMPDFVREDDRDPRTPVRPAMTANLTGWETVIFQLLVEEPEPEPAAGSASATAALAP